MLGKVQINDEVAKWSYTKIEKVFGDKAEAIAKVVGVKKPAAKKKSKEED